MEYYLILANRISSLCKDRGISINKLAKMSNINQSTIDNIMRGASKNPGIQTLHRIAYAFTMTISEFLDFSEINEVSFDDDTPEDAGS